MPTYCYTSKTGETVERFMAKPDDVSWDDWKPPESIRVGRMTYVRDFAVEQGAREPCMAWKQPMKAWTIAVHPSQRKQLASYLRRRGVPTHVDKDGVPHARSREHLNRILKARGMRNLDAGYGDYSGGQWDGPPPPKSARREYERDENGVDHLVKDCSLKDEPERDVRAELGAAMDGLYERVRSEYERMSPDKKHEVERQLREYAASQGA